MTVERRNKPINTDDDEIRYISAEEVKINDGSNGVYWTVIRNRVYDITKYVNGNTHPGGNIFPLISGVDGTEMMESYHPTISQKKATAILRSYYIGELKEEQEMGNEEFFLAVRERCDEKLKELGVGRHYYEMIAIAEVAITLILYILCSFKIAYSGNLWYAVILGLLTARLGFFMHMGGHRAISTNQVVNSLSAVLMDFIGGSSYIWAREHAVAHHCAPNVLWRDNDCSIAAPYLRFHPGLPWKWYHRFQAPGTVIGITFGIVKWFFSDLFDLAGGQVGSQTFKPDQADYIQLASFKFAYFLFHVCFPAYYHGFGYACLATFIGFAVAAHYLENVFITNHIQDGLIPDDNLHWSHKQVIGSADWSVGSHFWNWFSGGLNHQVVHHLFPSVSHWCYPYIAQTVKDTCAEFNLPYLEYDNLGQAYWGMLTFLHRLGKPPSDPEHLSHTKVVKKISLTEQYEYAYSY